MIGRRLILGGVLAFAGAPLLAHPHTDVDQQVALTLESQRIVAEIVIVPSISAGPDILARLDTDADGEVTGAEASAFAERVLETVDLEVSGQKVVFRQTKVVVPDPDGVEAGLGAIVISIQADLASNLTNGSDPSFQIGFNEFGHEWFIQPYLRGTAFEGVAIGIERKDDATIAITLAAGS